MEPERDAIVETHISWVHLRGDFVFKQKKPIKTAFLDYSTDDARKAACAEEVRLGRRLSPDVYLGVDRWSGAVGGSDWVVVMRRLPAESRLSTMVERRQSVDDALRNIAHRIASMHLRCGRSPAADAAASGIADLGRWETNLAEMAEHRGLLRDPGAADLVVDLARRYVAGRGALFAERIGAGRALDGHGDLLADDIFVMPDGPRILDSIEFDPRLRLGDGLGDIAFLAMDLERLGHAELGTRLLGWYANFAADRWPRSLESHYVAYRAQVRAKVACLRAAQLGMAAAPEADALLDLALRRLRAGSVKLTLVGGPPATGKSTIASGLAGQMGGVVLRSDEVRKELAGIPSTTSAAAPLLRGVYSPTMTSLTYGTLLRRARALLQRGESVILDATWADAEWREEAWRLAKLADSDLIQLRCELPVQVAAARARQRQGDPSDAGAEIAVALAGDFAPWPDALAIDTSGTPKDALDGAVRAMSGSEPSVLLT